MKSMMTVLICALAASLASAQSPSIIQNTRQTMNGVRDSEAAASNAALGVGQGTPSAGPAHIPAGEGGASARPSMTAGRRGAPAGHRARKHVRVAAVAVPSTTSAPAPKTPESKAPESPIAAGPSPAGSEGPEGDDPGAVEKKYNPNGKRDPFLSPVVSHAGGSGCSTGKKCLEIGAINLRGVVHSEAGFIAVVSNGLNKAYFLRENDPVFNGYVVKITPDSIVFQETLQDRLGKTFTREVVKKITTPAV